MAVTDTLRELREQVEQNLSEMKDTAALDALRVKVLGKKGTLTELLKGMGKLAPEERPKVGAQINEARQWLTERMNERQDVLQKLEREAALKAETIDVTEPRRPVKVGSAHPITLVMDELIDCFTGLGFEVMEGPEVELDHYNFELMNLPKNHPARDAQDTFYMDDNIVLRTHTSPMQARAMQEELEQSLPAATPVICAFRLGWPDQQLIRTRLDLLAETIEKNGLSRQTVVLVLPGEGEDAPLPRTCGPHTDHD